MKMVGVKENGPAPAVAAKFGWCSEGTWCHLLAQSWCWSGCFRWLFVLLCLLWIPRLGWILLCSLTVSDWMALMQYVKIILSVTGHQSWIINRWGQVIPMNRKVTYLCLLFPLKHSCNTSSIYQWEVTFLEGQKKDRWDAPYLLSCLSLVERNVVRKRMITNRF